MITGGFGMTMDLERGTMRQWVMGRDGVKRWADTNEPVLERDKAKPLSEDQWDVAKHGTGPLTGDY